MRSVCWQQEHRKSACARKSCTNEGQEVWRASGVPVHIPWLLNLNLDSVPQCMCSLGGAHMSSPPKAHSPCQPTTLMPSYSLVLWCGVVANPRLSQTIRIQRSRISKLDSQWLLHTRSEWGLDAPLLLSRYFPIREAVRPRFSRIPVSLPQSWFLEVFSTYGRALLLCAIHGFLGWKIKGVDMLCNSALGHGDRSRACGVMGQFWQAVGKLVDSVWLPVMSILPREEVGELQPESYPSPSFPAEGAKLFES